MTRVLDTGPIRTGELLGDKYLVGERIAAGGMGLVFDAMHVDLDRRVALKCLREEFAVDPEVVERFLNEARAVARLRNAHVAQVLDFGRTSTGAPYLVMERLEGADLGTILAERGFLPMTEAVDYVLQACSALAEAHAHGIVHRDLKPENLFLTAGTGGKPMIRLLDFGISKQLSVKASRSLTNPSRSIGSPFYMSPEQIRNARLVDARSDIWSLGVVLFELITGRHPFDAELVPEVYAQVLCDSPRGLCELRPDLPLGLDSILHQCLQKDRESRFADVSALAVALAPFASPAGRASVPVIAHIVTNGDSIRAPRPSSMPPTPALLEPATSMRSLMPTVDAGPLPTPRVSRARRFAVSASWAIAVLCLAGFAGARALPPDATRTLRDLVIEPKLGSDPVDTPMIGPSFELVPVVPLSNDGLAEPELEALVLPLPGPSRHGAVPVLASDAESEPDPAPGMEPGF